MRRGTDQRPGREQVDLDCDANEHHRSTHSVESSSMQEEQIGWVNREQEGGEEISISSASDEYMVRSTMKKNSVELKIPNARI